MDNNEAFQRGFIKRAAEAGLTPDETVALFSKVAFNDVPVSSSEIGDFKRMMQDDQGQAPVYDDDPNAAASYNKQLLQTRDKLTRSPALFAGMGGALKGGAVGATVGGLAGHGIGNLAASSMDHAKMSPATLKGLPTWLRTLGIGLGAVVGGTPAAISASKNVELANKLQDPRNLENTMRHMSLERRLANNPM